MSTLESCPQIQSASAEGHTLSLGSSTPILISNASELLAGLQTRPTALSLRCHKSKGDTMALLSQWQRPWKFVFI